MDHWILCPFRCAKVCANASTRRKCWKLGASKQSEQEKIRNGQRLLRRDDEHAQ